MFEEIKERLYKTAAFNELATSISEGKRRELVCSSLNGASVVFLMDFLRSQGIKKIIVVNSDSEELIRLRDDYTVISQYFEEASLFTSNTTLEADEITKCLTQLYEGKAFLIFADKEKLSQPLIPPDKFSNSIIELKSGEEYLYEELLEKLNLYGYLKTDFVEMPGDYSVRGGIVDIFPDDIESPVRLEFFGETIESIREFDISTQRSTRLINSVKLSLRINEETSENNTSYLRDFIPEDCVVFIYEDSYEETKDFFDKANKIIRITNFKSSDSIDFHTKPQPAFNSNISLLYNNLLELSEKNISINILCSDKYQMQRLKNIIEDYKEEHLDELADRTKFNFTLYPESLSGGFIQEESSLALYTEHQIFNRYFRQYKKRNRRFKSISFDELKELHTGDLVVHRDFGVGVYSGLITRRTGTSEEGEEIFQDFIQLKYAEGDKIYLALNHINLISKYTATEGYTPKLTRLGGGEWDKLKQRTKKKVQDIARDLILLYAKRKSSEGHAFQQDTHWERELEANFMYEDTPDQAKATADVKEDMTLPHPMDRLVCGDVGFGKTEVAVRSAFKAVLGGKQVALLVPTTILAVQHYNTFYDRLNPFAVEVGVLTRLKTRKEQKEILKRLEEGKLDIIIGTHRLLSGDLKFKDLGLLVIDEEQRFGVKAKEKLRSISPNVDTLTLTATPIPRTLNFSMLGARDLSIINTPPKNRKPIITEIINIDWKLIDGIIRRELGRGGQIYFVNDKISNIYLLADKIKKRIPEARVAVAHGQMDGNELEDIIVNFIAKKTNVLVCTKIIESGLDIPNVNTIIINNANMYGLSELYQLRGRVGRSALQAYAYFVSPPQGKLTRQAIRRLQSIEEYTELGSGFNLAMRDMEIRGVGNLLGKEQSGFVQQIGFDLFIDTIEEAVSELKEIEFKELFKDEKVKTVAASADDESPEKFTPLNKHLKTSLDKFRIEHNISAFIPGDYIANDTERINIYKRIYSLIPKENFDEVEDIRSELIDRFGRLPDEVDNLLELIKVRLSAISLGIESISLSENELMLELPQDKSNPIFESPFFKKLIAEMSDDKAGKYDIVPSRTHFIIKIKFPSNITSAKELTQVLEILKV